MHDLGHPLYLPLRLIHILGAMVMLGALVAGLQMKLNADRRGDAGHARRVHESLRNLDGAVIGPAAIVTFAAGYSMVRFLGGRIANHAFVLAGLILLTFALGFWYLGTRNIGQRLTMLAARADEADDTLGREYATRSAAWLGVTGGAVLMLLLAAVAMVFKLPGA